MADPKRVQDVGHVPPGAMVVGNYIMWPDSQGGLHPTPQGMISENMRVEPDQSRSAAGGCGQDLSLVPDPFRNK